MAIAAHQKIAGIFSESDLTEMLKKVQNHDGLSHAERYCTDQIETIIDVATNGNLPHCQAKLAKLQTYTNSLPNNAAGDFPAKAMISQLNGMLSTQVNRAIMNGDEVISLATSQSHLAAVPAQEKVSIARNFTVVSGADQTSANDDNYDMAATAVEISPATATLHHFNASKRDGLAASFSPAVMGEAPLATPQNQHGLMARYTPAMKPAALAA